MLVWGSFNMITNMAATAAAMFCTVLMMLSSYVLLKSCSREPIGMTQGNHA